MAHDTHTEEDAMSNGNVVWDAERGWHDGPRATVALDDRGKLKITPDTRYSNAHWHCESGLAGYGPDASNGPFTVHTDDTDGIRGLVESIGEELRTWADYERDGAHALAESGDYESAWNTLMDAHALDNLSYNFDNRRADAPLFKGHADDWPRHVRDVMIPEHFPHPVDEGRSNVYVWQCSEQECIDAADDAIAVI